MIIILSCFQLPLSGSLAALESGVDVTNVDAFNSLSRDHLRRCLSDADQHQQTAFNSLSRDHRRYYDLPRSSLLPRRLLSTPSLGITCTILFSPSEIETTYRSFQLPLSGSRISRKGDFIRTQLLSTPSLGITSLSSSRPTPARKTFNSLSRDHVSVTFSVPFSSSTILSTPSLGITRPSRASI